jgi:DNA-directed RNA polymerase specialized sigma24 family protein
MQSEQLERVTAAIEKLNHARQQCEMAHRERDVAVGELAKLVGVPDRGHKVLTHDGHVYELRRVGDYFQCSVTRIDMDLPF